MVTRESWDHGRELVGHWWAKVIDCEGRCGEVAVWRRFTGTRASSNES